MSTGGFYDLGADAPAGESPESQLLAEARKATHLVCPHCQGHIEFPKPVDHIMGGVFSGIGNMMGNLVAGQLLKVKEAEAILRKAGYRISKPVKEKTK